MLKIYNSYKLALLEQKSFGVIERALSFCSSSPYCSSSSSSSSSNSSPSSSSATNAVLWVPELVDIIFRYLMPSDLLKVELVSKYFRESVCLNLFWLDLCKSKWGVQVSQLGNNSFDPKIKFKTLYFHARRLPHNLCCCDSDLHLRGTQVSFRGKVGENSRSVKSNVPFPPLLVPSRNSSFLSMLTDPILCRKWGSHDEAKSRGYFSCPYLQNGKINPNIRSIAYYEVEIKKGIGSVRPSTFMEHLTREQGQVDGGGAVDDEVHLLPEVIAVGLSSSKFIADYRLPGWDMESYGYHGDDGMLFHGQGRQLAEYGPKFGFGDTIGCGIRYHDNAVFFTLNGKFLGDAFIITAGEWYPTVGIDSCADVNFNFIGPFRFNLKYATDVVTNAEQ